MKFSLQVYILYCDVYNWCVNINYICITSILLIIINM